MQGMDRRRAVCRLCQMVMDDCEPFSAHGEFRHATKHRDGTKSRCTNAGRLFVEGAKDIEPFMRKRERRRAKRIR